MYRALRQTTGTTHAWKTTVTVTPMSSMRARRV